ncbi:MAG: type II toxin-antitoxin system RelE/ParE family toxin [Gammaproteobacteria bacterium]|jgi:mRNA interferase RelE/StbE|nr:type II toxin-antitoxin system RelE/ParE family toxin [Gammaproteobacteria bacterium]MBT3869883.1 type II toxin-antitoxin system RelE/ParE family toxin [Gammaproteobacteria bacterium]MBT4378064.1 type II toxin-antitoxin system RelE/ParE family toxin [Gammaproteobacteria bacterium]MBT4618892.1 type II toxin-antitoxin system RelE/ParE family toxin [Gammaproteobacteria bacterium]MBT5197481.1 type II toxin-antitoxin system RelE/ParE family toxin [Gammaproteobacteria bacterium]
MASYEIRFKRSVAKDLRGIPKKDVKRILKTIDALAMDPFGPGCKKLAGQDYYRVMQGNFRAIYEVLNDVLIIHIVRVAHRSRAY